MSVQELMKYTYVSKYARYNKDANRRETWRESVDRVRDMMLRKYPQIPEEINWAYDLMYKKRVLGAQRVLQFGGKPIEDKNLRAYNCTFTYCDRLRFFQEAFYVLLCGCGVGYSVQKHHVGKLPAFSTSLKTAKIYVVPDTIEGWADSLGVLLSSYFESPVFPEYANSNIEFDFSEIRPEGSYLSSSSGKAPGPEPLKKALGIIKGLLDLCIANSQDRLKPINAHDIIMHASDAVLAGGVRRSSCISLCSVDDEEMISAKTGDWFYTNPQRARANNSVVLLRKDTTYEQYKNVFNYTREYGEPGIYWVDDLENGANPCNEIGLRGYSSKLESGFQGCNLSTINVKKCHSEDEFYEACKAASIIGTCQAGFTDFPYLGPISEEIFRREALLGVSMTGMAENPDIAFNEKIQRKGAKLIQEVNKEIAAKIGINPAARTTCIKPEGSASCLLGTSSGIHPHHAIRYLRRVQANALETPFQYFTKHNSLACEKSVWSANDTDSVISFTVEVPDGAKLRNKTSALELLELVKLTYENWIQYGKDVDLCVEPTLSHNVSNTITVKEEEWDDITRYVYRNRKCFGGISFVPASSDKDYQQAPFCAVYTPKEVVNHYGDGSLFASGLIVDGLSAFGHNLWLACDASLGILTPDNEPQEDWIRRAKQFAERYFGGDTKKMTYCLKDVHNWKTYVDLNREYKPVDYEQMFEDFDNTKPIEEIACAGGACLI